MDKKKTPLLGMTLLELQDLVIGLGLPKFTARQIAAWLYVKRSEEHTSELQSQR